MTEGGSGNAFDRVLVLCTLFLLTIGVVLIYSASIMESAREAQDGEFYLKRQLVYVALSLLVALICCAVPSLFWHKSCQHLFTLAIVLLIAVLVVGREVNGATRWISLGPVNLQPAELMKLAWVFFLSSYSYKHATEVRSTQKGFIKPLVLLAAFSWMILMQPDLGSCIVIGAITIGILFVAGAGLGKFLLVVLAFVVAVVGLTLAEPYRLARVLSFLDPWEDAFGTGYQLTQSLMAFGRGGVTGVGLGNSLQKLGYLPEAHTDFVTAILGEEYGFAGMCVVILLEFVIVMRAVRLSFAILRRAPCFQGYVAFGIAVWFALQTFINIGAASGMLPTKGLTLPLVSYGGSALIVSMTAIGVLLRIDFEWRNRILSVG